MKSILFVCTGNTCRSSMAEGLFNDAVSKSENLNGKFRAYSAGLAAYEGEFANPKALKVLRDHFNIDIKSHRARRIAQSDVEDALLILTMTRNHKDAVIHMFPGAKDKTYTLKEFISDTEFEKASEDYNFSMDIPDPYGMPEEVYKRCAFEINDAVLKLIEKLKEY